MTAQEFRNANKNVILRWAGHGCPGGQDIAILDDTILPFDLDEIEGEVEADGREFTATNLSDGSGAYGWKFYSWNTGIVWALWLRVDEAVWKRLYDEFMATS